MADETRTIKYLIEFVTGKSMSEIDKIGKDLDKKLGAIRTRAGKQGLLNSQVEKMEASAIEQAANKMFKVIQKGAKDTGFSLDQMVGKLDDDRDLQARMGMKMSAGASQAYGKAGVKATLEGRIKSLQAELKLEQDIAEAQMQANIENEKFDAKKLKNTQAWGKMQLEAIEENKKRDMSKQVKQGQALADAAAREANMVKLTNEQRKQMAMTKYSGQGQAIQVGDAGWGAKIDQTKNLIKQLSNEFKVSSGVAAKWAKDMDIDADIVQQALKEVRQEAKGLAGTLRQTFGNMQNYISTAFGVSLAMILFKASMAVTEFFSSSLQAAKDFRDNLRELSFSETILSQDGIDVTYDNLLGMAKELEALHIGLGKITSVDLVGQVAMAAKNIPGMTKEGLDKLTKSVAYIQAIMPEKEVGTIVNSLLDKSDRQINQIVQFNETDIKQKAVQMNLIDSMSSELSDQNAYIALQEIMWEKAGSKLGTYADSIKDTTKETENLAKEALEQQKVDFGQTLLEIMSEWQNFVIAVQPVVATILKLFSIAAKSVVTFIKILPLLDKQMNNTWKLLSAFINSGGLFNIDAQKENLKKWAEDSLKIVDEVNKTIKEGGVYEYGAVVPEYGDTPTGEPPADISGTLSEEQEEINKELDNILEDMNDFYADMVKMEEDYNTDVLRAREDFNRDMAKMLEDYEHDVQMVQQESNNDLAQENADYQNEELEAELKFQEDMRQLREKFLFDLEDALAQRDARQVIRLQKQYAMDVTNKTNEYELAQQARQRDHEQELEDIKNRVAERLAELKYEYELRKARAESDFLLEQQRADQDHTIDMARRQKEFEDKVTMWTDELVTEHGMKVRAAQLLLNDLKKFYGVDGAFHQMYYASYQDILNMTAQFRGLLNSMLSGGVPTMDLNRKVVPGSAPKRYAEGGAAVADKPTSAIFGDAGKELALFIPFNKLAQLGGAGGKGGGGSATDKVQIEVGLSPDLVGRVVNASMEGVAEVITRVSRG